MHRSLLLTPVLLAGALAFASAQQGVSDTPPLYRGPVTQVRGVFVTPISGVPFSAVVMIESEQLLPDGSVTIRRSQANIARDSRGRIRNELHMLVPDGYKGVPPLLSAHIYDPATRISYFLNPATLIARKQIAGSPRSEFDQPGAEDLGYQILNGMQAKGTRITRTVPAQLSGTGKEVKVSDEFWYSEDLHMNLLERHTDVRGGIQTVGILSIKTEEPDPSLFEVPAGYKVADLTPAEDSPAAKMNSRP
ncbi:MAG: hypothetical protein WBE72_02920 [Terracidiphilus sp.]